MNDPTIGGDLETSFAVSSPYGASAMKSGLRTFLALCAVPLGVSACTPTPPAQPRLVRSMLEERQSKVVIQQWDVSCGAAALASLLTYDMDVPLTERQVAAGLLHYTSVERYSSSLDFHCSTSSATPNRSASLLPASAT